MKYIFAFTVDIHTQEATLINQDHEGSKTYKGAVQGWFGALDGKCSAAPHIRWAIIEYEDDENGR